MASPLSHTDEEYREAARQIFAADGLIEVEEDAQIAWTDATTPVGAWVAAWVWVDEDSFPPPQRCSGAKIVDLHTRKEVTVRTRRK
jgi:hypothetical protein